MNINKTACYVAYFAFSAVALTACAAADGSDPRALGLSDGASASQIGPSTAALSAPVDGCSSSTRSGCAAYGCGCLQNNCSGGYCPTLIDGCDDSTRNSCASVGCGCLNGGCAGGYCAAQDDGCSTQTRQNLASGYACGCLDNKGYGGYCAITSVEQRYTAQGSRSVLQGYLCDDGSQPSGANCNSGALYRTFYPGSGGPYPVVSFGSGTNNDPSKYTELLNQIASWGFVIVAPNGALGYASEVTYADQMLGSLVALGHVTAGPLAGKADLTAIAAIGHSAGGTAAMLASWKANATGSSYKHISTALTLMRPAGCGALTSPCPSYDPNTITVNPGDAIFYIAGGNDSLSNTAVGPLYDNTPNTYVKAKGVRVGAEHTASQNVADGGNPSLIVGYATAWLRWRLGHDSFAGKAFSYPNELLSNSQWTQVATH
jgi:hypothetical protein